MLCKGQRQAEVSEGEMGLDVNRPTAQPLVTDVCPTPRRPEKHATSPGLQALAARVSVTLLSVPGRCDPSTLCRLPKL